MHADVAMIHSSSALGESVPLQKQFPDFYAGTSQADSENDQEQSKVIALVYVSVLLHRSEKKSSCVCML